MEEIREKLQAARLLPVGEAAVLVSFAEKIDPAVHHAVRAFAAKLAEKPFPGMIEYVEAFVQSELLFVLITSFSSFKYQPYEFHCCLL